MSSTAPRTRVAPDFWVLTNELRAKLCPQFDKLLTVIGLKNELGLGGLEWQALMKALHYAPAPGGSYDKQLTSAKPCGRLSRTDPNSWESLVQMLRPRRQSQEPEAPAIVTAEIDHLLGILAEAVLYRTGLFTPYTTIIRELTQVAANPRSFAAQRRRFSTETNTLVDRQFLLKGKRTHTSKIFGLTTTPRISVADFRLAAARARQELEAAYRLLKSGGEVPRDLAPFLRTPTSQSNDRLATALRKWTFGLTGKPTRVVQDGEATSGADPVLEIFLGPLNEMIEKYGGTSFSGDSLTRAIADVKNKSLKYQ